MTETTTQQTQIAAATARENGHTGLEPESEPGDPARETATTQSGAALFPQVVWAHFQWERKLHADQGLADAELLRDYQDRLARFQARVGDLEQVYWCTTTASAVAMSISQGPAPRFDVLRLRERDEQVRFHRVTDWVTRDAPHVADLLNECDLLASRVEQVLRGASQLIAMRSIVSIASHLLGFVERDAPKPGDRLARERAFVGEQRRRLAEVEEYYHHAASQAGRIVYVSGMLIGVAVIVVLGALAGLLLSLTSMSSYHRGLILLCYGCGAVGALVSAMSRMGDEQSGRFNLDFELGRRMVRRLGLFRPFVGGIFGVALAFVLASGLLSLKPDAGAEPYYFGLASFLAGFSERFAKVVVGGAGKRLIPVEARDGAGAPASPQGTRQTSTTSKGSKPATDSSG